MEMNQRKNVKPKMRGHKLRSGVNWQGALKEERRESNVRKTVP
jgi:hypothetical protein